jgi:hypothetical protein
MAFTAPKLVAPPPVKVAQPGRRLGVGVAASSVLRGTYCLGLVRPSGSVGYFESFIDDLAGHMGQGELLQ